MDSYELVVQTGPQAGESFAIAENITTIGRDTDSSVRLNEGTISRNHARIVQKDGKFLLEDLDSRNGCMVSGKLIKEPTPIDKDTVIRIGLNIMLRMRDSVDPLETLSSIDVPTIRLSKTGTASIGGRKEKTVPIAERGPAPYFLIIRGGKQSGQLFPLVKGQHSVGRADDNEILLQNPDISNHHAVIHVNGDGVRIQDLNSQNGTFVNQKPVTETTVIKLGDMLQIGASVLAQVDDTIPTGSLEA